MSNKHMKLYSIVLIIKEMKIKAKMRYHFTSLDVYNLKKWTSVGEDMKLEPLNAAGMNVN